MNQTENFGDDEILAFVKETLRRTDFTNLNKPINRGTPGLTVTTTEVGMPAQTMAEMKDGNDPYEQTSIIEYNAVMPNITGLLKLRGTVTVKNTKHSTHTNGDVLFVGAEYTTEEEFNKGNYTFIEQEIGVSETNTKLLPGTPQYAFSVNQTSDEIKGNSSVSRPPKIERMGISSEGTIAMETLDKDALTAKMAQMKYLLDTSLALALDTPGQTKPPVELVILKKRHIPSSRTSNINVNDQGIIVPLHGN